ncbi:MAG TPA: glutamine--fructose-6-phosphate transaminase (isomerizing) [Prolixibacteraceae bacterium]|nr:glutamine--fructose-6-phosphate transaminase (isomerizing) [Prolixibacteraceae bacterium]HRV87863.1 glutamine--fructose-6-phosphate transaminase (isomerizing) [Prolixibacteraceae bacterium]
MCGIVGYIGNKNVFPLLLNGLKRLEYRGYDSAGIALWGQNLRIYKKKGKVTDLEEYCSDKDVTGTLGIGHTRWATHGEPSDRNAHPHTSRNGLFTLVHNGIIENYAELRKDLLRHGYTFESDTDTEVLSNLIEYFYNQEAGIDAEMAVRLALSKVVGAYGIAVLARDEPGRLIAARKGSPLVIGVGRGEYFLASDAAPIVEHAEHVVYLNDHDVAIMERGSLTLKNIENNPVTLTIRQADITIGEMEKGEFEHYMLKEIFEQPRTIEETFRGRLRTGQPEIVLGGLMDVLPEVAAARRIILIGCGTSWHAALIGEYLIEEYARIPVEVEYASEFRYRHPVLGPGDIVMAISQSGETADTLAALRMAREKGALVLGICNVVGSSISRETVAGVYTHAGMEIGVASTKAFTAQVTVLTLLALKLAHTRQTIDGELYHALIAELAAVPEKARAILSQHLQVKAIAAEISEAGDALYLGRGILFPIALEGALKLKEISYIHAEGYAAGEMKHGPIALVDDNLPVIVVAPRDLYYEKIISNIQEVKARKGQILAVVTEGDHQMREMADLVMEIPTAHPAVTPLLAIIPLQLLAYYIAVMRGCHVDQPRNLAKSVTVE